MFGRNPSPQVPVAKTQPDDSYKSVNWISIYHAVNDMIAPDGIHSDAVARRTACLLAMLVQKLNESGKLTEHEIDDMLLSVRMVLPGAFG